MSGVLRHAVAPYFIGTWIVLGFLSAVLIFGPWHARTKTWLWRCFAVVAPVLFVWFIWLSDRSPGELELAVPAAIVIMLMNVRTVRFCPSCGRMQHPSTPFSFSPPDFCQRCGASLDGSDNAGAHRDLRH